MSYLFIENFEAGLDTRKLSFTAPPGTLRKLLNAHITRGREIERRKAFVDVGELPPRTFGLHSVKNRLMVFGSDPRPAGLPPIVRYQRLQPPGGASMVKLHSAENFQGKIYAVAEYSSGQVFHFYDGERVTDWDEISSDIGSIETVASALAFRLSANNVATVDDVDDTITLTSITPGEAFTVTVESGDMTVTTRQAAVPEQDEVRAEGSFQITGGSPGTTFNTVATVVVDGVDLISGPVDYVDDDGSAGNATTAQAVADRINAGISTYQASASGSVVTILAPPSLGASANGRQVSVTTSGDVTVGNVQDMSGGADPVSPIPQITDITVNSYDAGTVYELELDGQSYRIFGRASAMPLVTRTIQQKMYAVTGPFMYFSGFTGDPPLPDPTVWINDTADPPQQFGAGFIDMSTQYSGAEDLVGIGIYQNQAVAFSRDSAHIWKVDPDPAQNQLVQSLISVGAVARHSIAEYGDIDIFFLSDSGVRSLRARDSSNLASAADVGNPIDAELTEYMATLPRGDIRDAAAIVEPIDNRYLLGIGERIYVFSNFPGSKVSAWSTYELDGKVTDWAVSARRLYARVGDSVRLYGGFSGNEYDESETEVVLPFLDMGNPAEWAQIKAFDMGSVGTWLVDLAVEPNAPDYDMWEQSSLLTESTYGSEQKIGMVARSSHLALRFTTSRPERALIGNVVVEFDGIG